MGRASATDLPARNASARTWVMACREAGTIRAACPLEDASSGVVVSDAGLLPVAHAGAIASVLVIEAADLDGAVQIAKSYPNLVFGSPIEVRPIRPTAPRPATT